MKKTLYVITPLLAVLLVIAVLFFPSVEPILSCDPVGTFAGDRIVRVIPQ